MTDLPDSAEVQQVAVPVLVPHFEHVSHNGMADVKAGLQAGPGCIIVVPPGTGKIKTPVGDMIMRKRSMTKKMIQSH